MNQRLPSVKAKEVIRALERAGFVAARTSGSHCRLIHSSNPTRKVTVRGNDQIMETGTDLGYRNSDRSFT